MKWTRERPVKPGWHFYRDRIRTSGEATVFKVLLTRGNTGTVDLAVNSSGVRVPLESLDEGGEFAGPIPTPEE